jgi:hypothetical protein
MDVGDYLAAVAVAVAVAEAEAAGMVLPSDDRPVPATPWDPALRSAFAERRAVVHEERLIDGVLGA